MSSKEALQKLFDFVDNLETINEMTEDQKAAYRKLNEELETEIALEKQNV